VDCPAANPGSAARRRLCRSSFRYFAAIPAPGAQPAKNLYYEVSGNRWACPLAASPPQPFMAAQNSFDIVSQIDLQEVSNALQQALKEIHTRYDLKDSKSDIQLNEKDSKLVLASLDEYKLKAVTEVLQQKLVRRGVPLRGFTYGKIESAAGGTVRQEVAIQNGIPTEKAREIVKAIKDSKKKVQAAIQGDTVRVTGKDRDTLQEIIALLKAADFGIDMQFTNYRTL
jgi:uncharacterized protein YajQ (UPF0234 family)